MQLKDVNYKLHNFSAGLTNMWDFWEMQVLFSYVEVNELQTPKDDQSWRGREKLLMLHLFLALLDLQTMFLE